MQTERSSISYPAKGPVTHTITHVQRTKKEEYRTVRCDSLGVRQNSLMILRERRMNVIHSLCVSSRQRLRTFSAC